MIIDKIRLLFVCFTEDLPKLGDRSQSKLLGITINSKL